MNFENVDDRFCPTSPLGFHVEKVYILRKIVEGVRSFATGS